mgnify:CR=1 FL=1
MHGINHTRWYLRRYLTDMYRTIPHIIREQQQLPDSFQKQPYIFHTRMSTALWNVQHGTARYRRMATFLRSTTDIRTRACGTMCSRISARISGRAASCFTLPQHYGYSHPCLRHYVLISVALPNKNALTHASMARAFLLVTAYTLTSVLPGRRRAVCRRLYDRHRLSL